MSEETKATEEQTDVPEWQDRENMDDYLITSDDLVTEIYVVQGRPAMTLVGLTSLANEEGIDVASLETRESDKEITVIVSGKYKGITRWASHSEKKNPKDDHVWAKAFSKAQRNLFKIFLYGHQKVKDAFKEFAKQNGQGNRKAAYQAPKPTQRSQQPRANPQPKNDKDALQVARERCEKLLAGKQVDIRVDTQTYWREVATHFSVESLDKLTKEQWIELTNDLLKKGYGDITNHIIREFVLEDSLENVNA